ncbi:acVLRF1 family peptidyl-tRNA hydrolase [Microbispora sp. H10885]|uniref:acVLRF1 family peptidyl-tRNA hydrolase n=1 Tax=Microbispora sp. H10885 TaxID=2729110 RepID=UPI0015FF4DF3|nr:acVLRF1 family peptidyl-tRNA hydrolase [Microbispora sp. H10885]
MTGRPAAGGGRWVSVAPERLAGWIARFAARHGPIEAVTLPDVVRLDATDGAVAECHVPFPPLRPPSATLSAQSSAAPSVAPPGLAPPGLPAPAAALVAHACRERTVGVLLARLGGHAAGVFTGTRLVAAKAGSRQVHGRNAAGGWSQQRFARRRDKQSAEALRAAADVAFRLLTPRLADLEALVLGGDRRAIDEIREDRRLAPLFALEAGPFLTVPDPRPAVLEGAPDLFRAVRIRLLDP